MNNSKKENLGQYVARIMRQKGLKQKDIVLRSGGEIAGGYISDIINNKVANLSMDKFKALARGLDVNVLDLFAAACGEQGRLSTNDSLNDSLMLLDLMQQVVVAPALMEILQLGVHLTADEQEAVLINVKTFADMNQRARLKRKV
jgi:transcriptional regulator with XRE-family HTH domain